MKSMKLIRIIAMMLVATFGMVSCMPVTGTPEQQARAVEANSKMAQGVGAALIGVGAAAFGASQYRKARQRKVWYGPWGGYRYQYWSPRYNRWFWR
jgi:hypothetical protein